MKTMKKTLSMILCVLMLLGACACASAEQIANPWVEMTQEEAFASSGLELRVPDGAENVRFSYNESTGMLQLDFTLDGMEYTARAVPTTEEDTVESISGMYYEWEDAEETEIDGMEYDEFSAKDGDNSVRVCVWIDVVPGISYSLSTVQPDTDGLELAAIAAQIYVPMQGNA